MIGACSSLTALKQSKAGEISAKFYSVFASNKEDSMKVLPVCSFLAFVLLATVAASTQAMVSQQTVTVNTINTIAGGGPVNTNALTADVVFGSAASAIKDSSGNLYIAATSGQYIFKVTPAGVLSVIAGRGYSGFSGDGGLAVRALINNPEGISLDRKGNIYFADTLNQRIRKINASGKITTIAGNGQVCPSSTDTCGDGGPATQASFSNPTATAADSAGNLYVADNGDNRIRKVNASTGIITTVAGNGQICSSPNLCGDGGPAIDASFSGYLYEISVDASGNLYVSDTGNNRVRRVEASTRIIHTVAGNGFACSRPTGSCGDGELAVKASLTSPQGTSTDAAGNLYIADASDQKIRRVDGKTHIISTVAGIGVSGYNGDGQLATSAELSFPATVTVDRTGTLTIADSNNGRVRSVVLGGDMSTIAGGEGQNGDGGAAIKANLGSPIEVWPTATGYYISDTNNSRIRFVTSKGIISTIAGTGAGGYTGDGGPANQAQIDNPIGLGLDSSGDLFFSDASNYVIRKIDAGGFISTIAGTGIPCPSSTDPCGDSGPALNAQFSFVLDVKVDGKGNVFIADTFDSRIRRVDPSGNITDYAGDGTFCFPSTAACGDDGPADKAQLNAPSGIALDSKGNLYIADTGDCRIRRVDAATQIISTFAFTGVCVFGGNNGPAVSASRSAVGSLAFDSKGNLYVGPGGFGSASDEVVQVIEASTGNIVTVAGNPNSPLAAGFAGDGGPATKATLNGWGVAVSGTRLYIADWLNNRVRLVDLP
jgi:sugar lactone lactonase YvrE